MPHNAAVIRSLRSRKGFEPLTARFTAATLVAWYDCIDRKSLLAAGGDFAAIDGQVAKILDKSTNNKDLDTPAGGGPVRKAAGVLGDGLAQSIQRTAADWGAATAQPLDIFVALKMTTADVPAIQKIWDSADGTDSASCTVISTDVYRINSGASQTAAQNITTDMVIVNAVYDSPNCYLYVDGTAVIDDKDSGANSLDGFTLLGLYNNSSQFLDGLVGEAQLWQGGLTAAERTLILNFMAARHGVTL